MNKNALPADLLKRYLADACTDEERQVVDEWYHRLDQQEEGTRYTVDERKLLQRIRAQIAKVQIRDNTSPIPLKSRRWWYASGIAASVLLLLGVFYFINQKSTSDSLLTASAPAWIDHTNTSKKIERYSLPDRSTVWLHPGARLSHPTAFAAQREVRFVGEGFFDVTRDTLHPFILYSGVLTTQVLGTSFNVRAYEHDPSYHVSVVTGSVAVSTPASDSQKAETLVLKPNEQATFQSTTQSLSLEKISDKSEQKETWQPVSLVFADTPLSEVVARLQKTFRLKIELVNPALSKCRLTVDLNNQRLPEILEMINTLLNTTYELEGDIVRLSGEGCTS